MGSREIAVWAYASYKFGPKQPIMNGATSGGFKLQCIRNCHLSGARLISWKALGFAVIVLFFPFIYTVAWLSVAAHQHDKSLQWVDSIKYLRITITSSRTFTIDINQTRRKFFGCVNSILNHSCGASDLMKLYLMESYCYPVLSYALECFNLSNGCVRQLNACWNSVYRRIFLFKPWESVRELISYLERMNLEYLYYQKKLCFLNSMMHSDNNVIISVLGAFIHSVEFNKLCNIVRISPYDSRYKIKRCVKAKFSASVTSD